MKALALAIALAIPASAGAGPGGGGQPRRDTSGADAYRTAVVECTIARIATSLVDPQTAGQECIETMQAVWEASYGQGPCMPWLP